MKTRFVMGLVLCLFLSRPALAPAQTPAPAFPAKYWERIEKPESNEPAPEYDSILRNLNAARTTPARGANE